MSLASDFIAAFVTPYDLDASTQSQMIAWYTELATLIDAWDEGGGGGVSDGDKGDIVVSGGGSIYTIDSEVVTDGKIASGITASKITQTSSYRFVTDAEKTTWNSKETGGAAASALVSANNYTDSSISTLSASVISALAGKADALGADDNYVTDAEKVVIGNTSGTNTGDDAVNSLYSGLAASKLDVPTGTPDGTKYLRDDNTWQAVSGGSGLTQQQVEGIL